MSEKNFGSESNLSTSSVRSTFDYATATTGLTRVTIPLTSTNNFAYEAVTKASSTLLRGGYVSNWAQYDRKFDLEKVPPSCYNRLILAFLAIAGTQVNPDGDSSEIQAKVDAAAKAQQRNEFEIVSLDMWGDFQSRISARQNDTSLFPWIPAYGDVTREAYDLLTPENSLGLMGQLLWMRKQNPDLKISASIGGWTLSGPYKDLSKNWSGRHTFIQSVIEFIDKFGIDGIDIDWEYPQNHTEGEGYASLLAELRDALDNKFGKGKIELSSAIGGTPEHIEKIGEGNFSLAAKALDNIYVMSYDYWGAFSDYLGHQTNLYNYDTTPEPGDANRRPDINTMIEALLNVDGEGGKIDSTKIFLGIGNYARGKVFTGTFPAGNPGAATNVLTGNASFGTYEEGVVEGYDFFPHIAGRDNLAGINNFHLYTDGKRNADYYFNSVSGVYFSGDTPRTANLKSRYAKAYKLGGVFTWSVEQDYLGLHINAMNDGLGNTLKNEYSSLDTRKSYYSTHGANITAYEFEGLDTVYRLGEGDMHLVYGTNQLSSVYREGVLIAYKIPRDTSKRYSIRVRSALDSINKIVMTDIPADRSPDRSYTIYVSVHNVPSTYGLLAEMVELNDYESEAISSVMFNLL